MKSSASKIQLAGFDDLFQMSSEAEANGEQVREVPLTELFPFKDHPFLSDLRSPPLLCRLGHGRKCSCPLR